MLVLDLLDTMAERGEVVLDNDIIATLLATVTATYPEIPDTKRLQSAHARDNKLNRLAAVREKQNRTFCMLQYPKC